MLKRFLLPLLITLSTLSNSLYAQAGEGDYHVLKEINIILEAGDMSSTSMDAIRTRLKSKAGTVFSQEDFDEDLKILSRDFDRVEPETSFSNQETRITLHIWPKPRIRSIRWCGNDSILEGRLAKELATAPGVVFDRIAFSEAFHKVKAYYVRRGFFEAQLTYNTNLDEFTHEVDIEVQIDEGRSGRIRNIRYVNFSPAEELAISDMIVTKTFTAILSFFTDDGTLKKDMIQQDEFIILNYIQSRGFADARVKIDIEEVRQGRRPRVDIVISLERGKRYELGSLTFEGSTVFTDEQIHELFPVDSGSAFAPDQLRDTARRIGDFYGRKGFIDAYASFEPSLRLEEAVYDVHFNIIEGDQYRVGMVKVFGNCTTCPEVILHETLLIPGEVFNIQKLQQSEQRLRNIGFFECVNVYAVRSEDEDEVGPRFRDVHIEVEEASTGDFGFSFGYSTAENAFAGLNFTERNFDYRGLPCLFSDGYGAVRGGGQYLGARANIGSRNQRYVLSWTEPYFRDSDWSVGFDLEKSNYQTDSDGYRVDAYGASMHATRSINQFLKAAWHYRLRYTDVDLGDVTNPTPKLIDEADNSGLISGTGMSLIYDSTNHPALPTCGFRSRLSAEYVGLGGKHTFLNLSYLNSYYYSPEPCVIIKFRGDARVLAPIGETDLGNLPIDERLFLGGEGTVRGYSHLGIGPRYANGDPRGGLSMLLFSAEYVYKAFKSADLFLFADSGMLSAGQWKVGDFSSSVGYGTRLYVFPGGPPLTFGMGYAVDPAPDDKVKEFFMTMGGRF